MIFQPEIPDRIAVRDDRANADHLLDALMEATAKLRKVRELVDDELEWNAGATNFEVRLLADEIRAVLDGVDSE